MKSFFEGLIAIETRTKTLQDYMNGLIAINNRSQIKKLLQCPHFDEFIDFISKLEESLIGCLLLVQFKKFNRSVHPV